MFGPYGYPYEDHGDPEVDARWRAALDPTTPFAVYQDSMAVCNAILPPDEQDVIERRARHTTD